MDAAADLLRRQAVLLRAGMALASELSLPAVLTKIVGLACEVAGARYGAHGILGRDGGLENFITHGVTEEEHRAIGRLPEGKGLLGALIDEARPLRLGRIQDDPRSVGFPSNHPPMTSFLGVPVTVRGKVFGNLYLTDKQGAGEFTAEDEDAVMTLAAQAGVAIENARLHREERKRERRLEAINEVSQAILEGRDVDDLLHLIAGRARELAGADLAIVATPEPGGDILVLRAAEGHRADLLRGMQFTASESVSGEVMRNRRPLMLQDASADERTHQPILRAGDVGPAVFVPLAARDRMFGTLAVGNRRGGPQFTEEDLYLVQIFAVQAAVALDYARIHEELRRLAIVEERERIAKELHDDSIQSLFAVGMALQAAEAMTAGSTISVRLSGAVDQIDRVIRDLRNYIFGLRPGVLADRQLDGSLRELAMEFAGGSGPVIQVRTDLVAVSRLAVRAGDVVQLAREALSNAVRHSRGSRINLGLTVTGSAAMLEVEDDGVGFDPGKAAGKGFGLANLRERAEAIGGELEIDSAIGRGSRLRVWIPM